MAPTKPTRRQVMVSASATALAATAGVFYATDDARAVDVSVTNLEIPEQEKSAPDAPDAIMLRLTGKYAVDANVTPDKLVLTPKAKTDGSTLGYTTLESEELLLDSSTATGQIDLERNLLALSGLRDVFPTTEGESSTTKVAVELVAEVYADGSVIGSDSATATFPLTLGHEAAQAAIGFEVNGDVVLE